LIKIYIEVREKQVDNGNGIGCFDLIKWYLIGIILKLKLFGEKKDERRARLWQTGQSIGSTTDEDAEKAIRDAQQIYDFCRIDSIDTFKLSFDFDGDFLFV